MAGDTAFPGSGGRLADVLATRGRRATPEAPFVIEHREALIYMLCLAAELEHAIMCQYLYTAFSLKQGVDEGLSPGRWRPWSAGAGRSSGVATQEMLHLALVQNLLASVGAAPRLSRPNLPAPVGHYPAGVALALLPFGEPALRHFLYLERPEGVALDDAEGLAALRQATTAVAVEAGEIVPRLQDFATVGHLYRSIEAGFRHLAEKYGEGRLFCSPPRAQASTAHFSWPELVSVGDLASAQAALDTIIEQGEGPRGDWRTAHFGRFVAVLDEFLELRRRDPTFEPARPVWPANVRPPERDTPVPLITDPDHGPLRGPLQRGVRGAAASAAALLRAHRGDRLPARRAGGCRRRPHGQRPPAVRAAGHAPPGGPGSSGHDGRAELRALL